ncbi:hypothetical protein AHAS_Ahas03G0121100 [Arachis hypogaea]
MGFGTLAHIWELNISHKLLRKLILALMSIMDSWTLYDKIYITPAKIRDALGINFGGEANMLKFKRTFVVFIWKCFLILTIFPNPKADDAPGPPWVAYWTQRRLVEWIALETRTFDKSRIEGGEIEQKKGEKKKKKKKEKK